MKKALLVVSFGTSYPDTCEKNIVACERELAASCPDRDTFRAFTSGMIIRKLKQRDGIEIDTPLQALQKLAEQGYQDVAIQSLHIINGDEYEKIVREVQSLRPLFLRLTLGAPLLSSHNDYVQLMQALRQQMPPIAADETVVFMGHGASHHAFAAYACLDHMMTAKGFSGAGRRGRELSGSRYSYRQPAPAGGEGRAPDAADAGGRRSRH
ncbi:Sirohydrochlorin cobaltochelatase CbiK [Klebsiella michiganensis]|nr:Sirohydrochlorin cobaltochelatase CbiK [Klebsiella michiganensis]